MVKYAEDSCLVENTHVSNHVTMVLAGRVRFGYLHAVIVARFRRTFYATIEQKKGIAVSLM